MYNHYMEDQTEKIKNREVLSAPLTIEQLKLLAMPLSGVTSRYGVDGLLKRYIAQTKDLDKTGLEACNQAIAIASELFVEDTYKNEPYLTHLLRVALRLHRDFGITDTDIIVAAILHDTIEDHPDGIKHIAGPEYVTAHAAVASLFGSTVANIVQALSNDPQPPGLSLAEKQAHYQEGVRKKLALSFEVFIIKLSDFIDNAVGLHWGEDDSKLLKLANKYYPLFDDFIAFSRKYFEEGRLTQAQLDLATSQMQKGKLMCSSYISSI